MSLLSDSDLASAKATAAEALPSSSTIRRRIQKSDGQGGKETSFANRATNVPCRLDPTRKEGEAEPPRGGRATALSDFLITFEAGTTVEPLDQVLINGRTFEVDRVRDREEWEITRRVEASEINSGGDAPSS